MAVHVGDYGFDVTLTFYDQDGNIFPIDAATTKQIVFEKPGESNVAKDGLFVTDGTDGKLTYSVEQDIIDIAGVWSIQGYVLGPTYAHFSTTVTMPVFDVL